MVVSPQGRWGATFAPEIGGSRSILSCGILVEYRELPPRWRVRGRKLSTLPLLPSRRRRGESSSLGASRLRDLGFGFGFLACRCVVPFLGSRVSVCTCIPLFARVGEFLFNFYFLFLRTRYGSCGRVNLGSIKPM